MRSNSLLEFEDGSEKKEGKEHWHLMSWVLLEKKNLGPLNRPQDHGVGLFQCYILSFLFYHG